MAPVRLYGWDLPGNSGVAAQKRFACAEAIEVAHEQSTANLAQNDSNA
jgi:hypothetical protein